MIFFSFVAGLVGGCTVGMVVMACLSARAYNRGYDDGLEEFKYRKGE